MVVALLGWARLSSQAREGSGYNLVASELAAGLAFGGHRVHALRSGFEYSLRPGMRIARDETWCGVACWSLVNSPNLSPAVFNFLNMQRERSSPAQTRLVLRWLDRVGAEVVHVHSLEGYGLDLLPAIERSGRPAIVTPHNYWYACPQVDLLHAGTHVCTDYEGGRRCVGCVVPARPRRAKMRRVLEQTGSRVGPLGTEFVRTLLRTRERLTNGESAPGDPWRRRRHRDPPIDPDLALGLDPGGDDAGLVGASIPIDEDEEIAEPGRSPMDQNERFLEAGHHLRVLNEYGRRRVEGIDALNHAALVTPPSRFMRDVYERMGVAGSRLRHVRLGLPHLDRVTRRVRRSGFYGARPWDLARSDRPVRFAFFGTVRPNKGLDVLVRAIRALEPDVRRRCHFSIRAGGGDWLMRRRLARYPEVSFLGGYDLLHLISACVEFDVGILPHVWFENSPIVLLEYLHAGRFVIASRLGGPPEWIVEPGSPASAGNGGLGNGLMFPGGDPESLAERITRVATGQVRLPSPREVHAVTALRSFPDFVGETESIYREALGEAGACPGVRLEAPASAREAPVA